MPRTRTTAPTKTSVGETLTTLLASFERSVRAENLSPRTIQSYMEGLHLFAAFLRTQGMPQEVSNLTREHCKAFITHLLEAVNPRTGQPFRPATVVNRYKSCQAFFKWCDAEGEIRHSPMANMRPPKVEEAPPPVLSEADLRKLLKVCEGKDFTSRRDMALLRLLIDTGMRRAELAGLKVADLDWEHNLAVVAGKGRKVRPCPFGRKTAQALDRYLRARASHPDADCPELWVGRAGPMTENGIY